MLLVNALKAEYGITCAPVFTFNKNKQPALADYPEIFFNIAHCPAGVVCATGKAEQGADIEAVKPYSVKTARRVFCNDELELLDNAENTQLEFARLWTRKEAYLKMCARGLTGDVRDVNTTLLPGIKTFDCNGYVISVCGCDSNSLTYISL